MTFGHHTQMCMPSSNERKKRAKSFILNSDRQNNDIQFPDYISVIICMYTYRTLIE